MNLSANVNEKAGFTLLLRIKWDSMNMKTFETEYSKIERLYGRGIERNNGTIILSCDTVKLLSLLNDTRINEITLIPNLSRGELSLCADKWIGYAAENQSFDNSMSGKVIYEDFVSACIKEKYQSIVVFPPFGVRTEFGRSEVAYIDKCLDLLCDGGSLVALVPQNITTAPAFKKLRERILSEFSLEAVITVKHISISTRVECSVLVIENKSQTDSIYMSTAGENAEMIYKGFVDGSSGFYTNSSDVYDRIDANYFDPKYKEIRKFIQNRDTVKIGELAEVYSGMMIPSQERKDHGDYLVIKPQYIFDGEVHLGNERKIFCTRELIETDNRW